jgi:hypothetical protein
MRVSLIGGFLAGQFRQLNRLFVHDRFAAGQLCRMGLPAKFLAFAYDPSIHDASAESGIGEPRGELVFTGNPDEERVRYLEAIADLGLELWGNWGWARLKPSHPLYGCIRGGVQLGREMVGRLANRISINILRRSQKTAHNMRTFEAPGCGACSLSEASNGVLELMRDGVEVVTFTTPQELRVAALALIGEPARRNELAAAGRERVRNDTYLLRARSVLEEL